METERMLLRPWYENDAEALFKSGVGPRVGWADRPVRVMKLERPS